MWMRTQAYPLGIGLPWGMAPFSMDAQLRAIPIGMGAIILNHAEIRSNCIIGAGTLVTQNTVVPDGSLVIGNPGKVVRSVTASEMENIRQNAAQYVKEAADYAEGRMD